VVRSNYTFSIIGNILFIEDLNGAVSVTNDIENVLEFIQQNQLSPPIDSYDVIYRDSDGIIDGILTRDGEFKDFYLIGERDLEKAKLKIQKHEV